MHFDTDVHSAELPALFRRFFEFVPDASWDRRFRTFQSQIEVNPLIETYLDLRFPIERAMHRAIEYWTRTGGYPPMEAGYYDLYGFVATGSRVYARLTNSAKHSMASQLRGALTSGSPLTPWVLEMSVATHLMLAGYDVHFSDLERGGGFDFLVSKDGLEFEVDCKTASGDVGRRIHQRRLYQLAAMISGTMKQAVDRGNGVLVRVQLPDALRGHESQMRAIAGVINSALDKWGGSTNPTLCKLDVQVFDPALSPFSYPEKPSEEEVREFLAARFSIHDPCAISTHVAGRGAVVVALESQQPDKKVEGVYRQLKASAKNQFSRVRPAMLFLRLTDLPAPDLITLARTEESGRSGLGSIANRLLSGEKRQHLVRVAFLAPAGQITQSKQAVSVGISTTVSQDRGIAFHFLNSRHPLAKDERLRVFPSQ